MRLTEDAAALINRRLAFRVTLGLSYKFVTLVNFYIIRHSFFEINSQQSDKIIQEVSNRSLATAAVATVSSYVWKYRHAKKFAKSGTYVIIMRMDQRGCATSCHVVTADNTSQKESSDYPGLTLTDPTSL
jgi:hypothetical protein